MYFMRSNDNNNDIIIITINNYNDRVVVESCPLRTYEWRLSL